MVGPRYGPGEESFDILVCTADWLAAEAKRGVPVSGRHALIMERIDLDVVERYVRDFVAQFDEPTWGELAEKIGRLGNSRTIGTEGAGARCAGNPLGRIVARRFARVGGARVRMLPGYATNDAVGGGCCRGDGEHRGTGGLR
ncbi:hypothetical protein F5X71_33590 [Nocardia brasiliensis]|uniref:Uncharacterized protein n=1 Tax=Nocardia brasiliensis TaxID=37326 RepID=A0A6G9Y0E5_NOCBR|nr:hypothetical protein F5X71_33590 [Nocardia brasiliensis]